MEFIARKDMKSDLPIKQLKYYAKHSETVELNDEMIYRAFTRIIKNFGCSVEDFTKDFVINITGYENSEGKFVMEYTYNRLAKREE